MSSLLVVRSTGVGASSSITHQMHRINEWTGYSASDDFVSENFLYSNVNDLNPLDIAYQVVTDYSNDYDNGIYSSHGDTIPFACGKMDSISLPTPLPAWGSLTGVDWLITGHQNVYASLANAINATLAPNIGPTAGSGVYFWPADIPSSDPNYWRVRCWPAVGYSDPPMTWVQAGAYPIHLPASLFYRDNTTTPPGSPPYSSVYGHTGTVPAGWLTSNWGQTLRLKVQIDSHWSGAGNPDYYIQYALPPFFPYFGDYESRGDVTVTQDATGIQLLLLLTFSGDVTSGGGGAEGDIRPGPAIIHDRLTRYYMANDFNKAGDVYFRSSFYSIPAGWAQPADVKVTASAAGPPVVTYGEPSVVHRWDSRLLLVCTRKTVSGGTSLDIMLFTSDDRGATWSTGMVLIPGANRVRIAAHPQTGALLAVAQVGGILTGAYQSPGDTAFSAPFTLHDATGSNITAASIHDISASADGADRWLLACPVGSDVVHFYSTDQGRTWTQLS